jgi:hypothetical protein
MIYAGLTVNGIKNGIIAAQLRRPGINGRQ